ncbi:T-box protein H15 [Daphnia magna]|uniref:Uncharacterized protein n=1 Tax=Daphnia magna TaxID=35525 RepID=A0ABQ9ZAD4_9CRUS|nr:T-box protein H15 [Daphnia magna]KAK4009860.1 hypothetical protein OUZ56_019005 [Daphnia magna]
MGGHGGHHNSCNYSSGSSAGGGPTSNKRHRPDHSPNGNDSDDDVDLLMDDANGSGPLSPGAESLIDSDNSSISLTGPPSPVGDMTSAGALGSAGNDAASILKSSIGGDMGRGGQPSNPLTMSTGGLLSDPIHHSRDREQHHAAAMALSSAGLMAPAPPSHHHHHHPSAFTFGHHPHHHPSFGANSLMAAAAGLHFNLAASLGNAPLTPFGAFGSLSNPFAAAVAPFGSRFNGGNNRPNGSSGGGKPPTSFDMSLAETLGHHHHAAAMAAAAAAAELAAYHHAAQQHQQQQQQQHQQHQQATTQTTSIVSPTIEPLKLKSDLIITSSKSNHSGSSRSSRSSNSSRHSGRSTPPTPPTPPQKTSILHQHEMVAETGTQAS